MKTYCGVDCLKCYKKENCKGCVDTLGHPFSGYCLAAEIIKEKGIDAYKEYKQKAIEEINNLKINDLPIVDNLFELCGELVNIEYELEDLKRIKLLNDNDIYLGCQIEKPNTDEYFGIIVTKDNIIVSEYKENGDNAKIIKYIARDEDMLNDRF